jgi:hypothetical protein
LQQWATARLAEVDGSDAAATGEVWRSSVMAISPSAAGIPAVIFIVREWEK